MNLYVCMNLTRIRMRKAATEGQSALVDQGGTKKNLSIVLVRHYCKLYTGRHLMVLRCQD